MAQLRAGSFGRTLFPLLCLIAVLVPGAWAGYVRSPSSTTGSTARGSFGSASLSTRQKNQDDEKPARTESATNFFVNEKEDGNDDKQEEGDDDSFFETDLPTGIIPTTSPAPTESPSMFPTFDNNNTAVNATVRPTAQPSTKLPTAPITNRPSLPPGSTAAPVISTTGVPTTAPPTRGNITTGRPTESPTFMPSPTFTSGPTTASSYDWELVNDTNLSSETGSPTSDFYFNDTIINGTLGLTDDSVLLDEGLGLGDLPIPPEEDWTKVTFYPTASPTSGIPTLDEDEPEFPVSGQLSLRLNGIARPLDGDTRMIFLAAADEFIASAAMGHVQDVKVLLMYQRVVPPEAWRRKLQEQTVDQAGVLQVDLGVEGLAFDEMLSARDWNMWLLNLFSQGGPAFVTMVQDVGEAESETFFDPLTQVQALEPDTAILAPSLTPTNTSIVLPPPLIASSNQNNNAGNDNDEGTPMVAIIGAAVGGFVLILIGLILVRYVVVLERKKQASSPGSRERRSTTSLDENFGPSSAKANNPTKKSNKKNSTSSTAIQTKPSAGESIVSSNSYLTNGTNNFNLTSSSAIGASNSGPQILSSPPSESDIQSHMGGTTNGDMSVMDNMSYAYSLEPGIEPSVAGVPHSVFPSSGASAMSYSIHPGGSSVASLTSGTSSFGFMKLPTRNRGGNIPSGGSGGKRTKDVLAPPGKLGIVIDTTLDGPVVHKVNPGSALEGKLRSGDIIVAIDGVDTRAMTAASITALMVKTANQRRKLTIITP